MKNLFLGLAILLCLLKTGSLFSQDEQPPLHGIAAKVLFIDYGSPNSADFQVSNGLELAYLRHIKDNWAVGLPVKIGVADLPGDISKSTFVSFDAIGQYRFTSPEKTLIPYGFAGLGIVFDGSDKNNLQVPVGLGLYYKVGESSYITGQVEYRKSFDDNRDNLQLGLGWYYKLKATPRPPGPADADNDGIPDSEDRCPDEPGIALAFGCPDTDKDGVPNGEDDCPTEKGSFANRGCPSPGDKDADGIADKDDKCPDVPGIASLDGCPPPEAVSSIDTDGDGVTDDKDNCPDTAGEINLFGCPDRDGDGVADKDDRCPDEVGLPIRHGCPPKDTDKDGILDEDDACPTIPGKAATNGCPDKDGDGVGDAEDDCPDTPGFASAKGCPDMDGDGVPDRSDKCPNMVGEAAHDGCPFIDSDGDGIDDSEDDCPNEKGSKELLGCPDGDGDGIPDRLDQCPTEAGTADRNGCPIRDADNDGVEDKFDNCPDEPGTEKAHGCPDRDGDGFGDPFDKCPDEVGTNKGCPDLNEEEREFLRFAAKNIYFDTGKATLRAKSYTTLNRVADILMKYPRYHLSIGGHTDNVGNAESNRLLSEERARTCHEYLLSRGLTTDRMSFKGYGESQPVADNSTEEGRLANRRVEFTVYLP